MKIGGSIGNICLSAYLILIGVTTLFSIAIPPIAMGVLALVAGVLMLIGK